LSAICFKQLSYEERKEIFSFILPVPTECLTGYPRPKLQTHLSCETEHKNTKEQKVKKEQRKKSVQNHRASLSQ